MLTKDLVQVTVRSGKIFPRLCPPGDSKGLADADEICEFFRTTPGKTLSEVEDELKNLCTSPRRRALAKLMLDRCGISDPDAKTLELRWTVFKMAEGLRRNHNLTFESFVDTVSNELNLTAEDIRQNIFADLPGARTIKTSEALKSRDLLELLNISQAKAILCMAKEMTLEIKNASLSQRREVLRQVKFHRLIAQVGAPESSVLSIKLSGPLSGFGGGVSYGVRLANLFNFILSLSEWSLDAEVKWKGKSLQLSLDQKSGLKSRHSRSEGSFAPPEFRQLIESLDGGSGITAKPGNDFIKFDGDDYCFPDLVLTTGARSFSVELFHGSHKSQITRRLKEVSRLGLKDFLIGIDRSVLKDKELAELIANSEWFKSFGFEFNQFPTPSAIKKVVMRHV
jgi:uncharacterized protein